MKTFLMPLAVGVIFFCPDLLAADGRGRLDNRPGGPEKPPSAMPKASPQASLSRLVVHLGELKSKAKAAPALRDQLQSNLSALAGGAGKPSAKSVGKLAGDLSLSMTGHSASAAEQQMLARDIYVAFNSAILSASELETILKDARTILKSAGIAKADADEIAEDLKTIATEVRSSAAN